MMKKIGLLSIIILVITLVIGIFASRFLNPQDKSADSEIVTLPAPTDLPAGMEITDTDIESQINQIQTSIDQLSTAEKTYTQLDQTLDDK